MASGPGPRTYIPNTHGPLGLLTHNNNARRTHSEPDDDSTSGLFAVHESSSARIAFCIASVWCALNIEHSISAWPGAHGGRMESTYKSRAKFGTSCGPLIIPRRTSARWRVWSLRLHRNGGRSACGLEL